MKLLHTSDWHLGMTFRGREIAEDQEYFIKQIGDIIVSEQVDAVLLAGDIFDRSVSPASAIAMYDRAMTHICGELNVPVLLVAGNHDGAQRLASCNELLKKAGLYIAGSLTRGIQPVTLEDTDIYLLPWFTLEKVRALYPERVEELQTLEDAYELVCNEIRASFHPEHKHLLVAHAFIVDAETSVSDRAAEVGAATAVSAHVFREFDYVALGHIHRPQNITKRIRYSGTPMPYSFGKEEKQEKSVTIIDTSVMKLAEEEQNADMKSGVQEAQKSEGMRIHPLKPLHARVTLKGTYEELCTAMNGTLTKEQRTGYVRLEVTDSYVGIEAFAALQEVYPNVLEVAGKSFEQEDSRITMSLEDLEAREADPVQIFRQYFKDNNQEEPSEHFIELFEEAVADYEKEVSEG